jgi:hypothetical protein
MSLLSRLFGRGERVGLPEPVAAPVDTLVEDPRVSATRLGAVPKITPWSATRLAGIFQAFESNPSYATLAEARLARQCLSQFWLVAPVDQLEVLYRSPIGECYRVLLAGRLAQEPLLNEEQGWKNTLTQRLMTSFERPETTNVLLAAMPYFPPGKMRVADPLTQVPGWLQEDYARLFDPQLLQRIWQPAGLLGPAGQAYGQAPSLGLTGAASPSLAGGVVAPVGDGRFQVRLPALPQLATRRGDDALALVQDPEFQSRMQGLINLHVIDPSDGDVQQELVELRRLLGQIWLDAPADQLERLYKSSFGQLYRDLLSSGFPRLQVSQEDRLLRNRLAQLVADMSQPGAINALMAVLPFYAPGKIAFGGGEQHMPVWLVREIAGIYGAGSSGEGVGEGAAPAGQP